MVLNHLKPGKRSISKIHGAVAMSTITELAMAMVLVLPGCDRGESVARYKLLSAGSNTVYRIDGLSGDVCIVSERGVRHVESSRTNVTHWPAAQDFPITGASTEVSTKFDSGTVCVMASITPYSEKLWSKMGKKFIEVRFYDSDGFPISNTQIAFSGMERVGDSLVGFECEEADPSRYERISRRSLLIPPPLAGTEDTAK